jgi:hypothetical protein
MEPEQIKTDLIIMSSEILELITEISPTIPQSKKQKQLDANLEFVLEKITELQADKKMNLDAIRFYLVRMMDIYFKLKQLTPKN